MSKETLTQIIEASQKAIEENQKVKALAEGLLEPGKFIRITAAYWENGQIVVEFEANVNIDLHYWYGDKVHEVEDYIDGEIDQSTGRHEIGVNEFEKDWNVQAVGEEVESEVVNVGPLKKVESPAEEIKTISTNPDDWEVQGKILDGKKIVAGVVDINGVAHMLVQSQRKIDGVWTNCGELYLSEDLKEWTPSMHNPVLITPMDWQGQNNGIPHRVAPRTLINHKGEHITYTRDRNGDYPGIRGVGVFTSKDMIEWKGYDTWFTDVEQVIQKVPFNQITGNGYERCYLKCATVKGNEIYIIVNIEDVNGTDSTFVFKGVDPLDFDSFEYIDAPWHSGGRAVDNIYFINGECFQFGRGDSGFNSIRIEKGWKPFELGEGIPIDHDGPRETIFPFYFQDRWHLLYDDNKSGPDGEPTRNIHLSTQIK